MTPEEKFLETMGFRKSRQPNFAEVIILLEKYRELQTKIMLQRIKNIDTTDSETFAEWILDEGWQKCTEHDGLWQNDNSHSLKTSRRLYEQFKEDTKDTDEV